MEQLIKDFENNPLIQSVLNFVEYVPEVGAYAPKDHNSPKHANKCIWINGALYGFKLSYYHYKALLNFCENQKEKNHEYGSSGHLQYDKVIEFSKSLDMKNIKPGDKLICICDTDTDALKLGNQYTVLELDGFDTLYIEEHKRYSFLKTRFISIGNGDYDE